MRKIIYYNASKQTTKLLDVVPNASFAFDFLKLRADYSGYCIKVLRDSDNAVMDIGFVGNILDTTTLMTFIGSDTGFVHTAYDQSLNANHAKITVKANMPRIVNAGVLEVFNGKPALRFMGNQHFELANTINLITGGGSTIVSVGARLDGTKPYTTFGILGSPGGNPPTLTMTSSNWFFAISHGSTRYMSTPNVGLNQKIMIAKSDSSTEKLVSNNTDISVAVLGTSNAFFLNIIGKFTTDGLVIGTDGYMQNIMHYNYKVDTAQENDINTFLNAHYGAY